MRSRDGPLRESAITSLGFLVVFVSTGSIRSSVIDYNQQHRKLRGFSGRGVAFARTSSQPSVHQCHDHITYCTNEARVTYLADKMAKSK